MCYKKTLFTIYIYIKKINITICSLFSEIIYVEVLDSSNCLYDTIIPNGMMKLKLRLKSKLNFAVIKVRKVILVFLIKIIYLIPFNNIFHLAEP